jgi:hypothetical protein
MTKQELLSKASDLRYAIAMEADCVLASCLEKELEKTEKELEQYE